MWFKAPRAHSVPYQGAPRDSDDMTGKPFAGRGRLAVLALSLCSVLLFWFWTSGDPRGLLHTQHLPTDAFFGKTFRQWSYPADANNLQLTSTQCDHAFPDLFVEVDRAVLAWKDSPIDEVKLDRTAAKNGFVRAMIYDQNL
jgi:hypothetical protein